jgi:hypothetical protein
MGDAHRFRGRIAVERRNDPGGQTRHALRREQ